MINNKIIKLKKYLFLISILFFVLLISHLYYTFLYSDSKYVATKWWTVSEWLIWDFPSLNPLKTLDWNNKYLVSLLYRSLLTYDLSKWKIVWDIANCDISNVKNVECFLNDNIFWSSWEKITTKDILLTYEILKNSDVNKVMSSLLEETEIEENWNTIIFKNKKEDINFLNIFFQPILSVETINSIWTDNLFWDFPTHNQIYSWDFKISNISSDMTIWITEILLERNPYYNNWNISKLIIKLFPNTNSLLSNKDKINIFNDTSNLIWESVPRLWNYKYTLSQYVSLFLNSEKISDINLRNYILNKINRENLLKIIWESWYKKVINPYLSDINIEKEIEEKNFEKIMEDMWYNKKSKIIEKYTPIKNTYSNEAKIEKKPKKIKDEELVIDSFQKDLEYIKNPEVKKYNFTTKDNLLIEWIANSYVSEVYINDYKLSWYKSGDLKFYYRLKESYNSINTWINEYKIYFVENWEKIEKEEFIYIYEKDNDKLEETKKEFIKNKIIEQRKIEEKIKEEEVLIEIDKWVLQKLTTLSDSLYYNKDLESFSLNLFYLSWEKVLEDTANFIKNSLLEIWVNVIIKPISLNELWKTITDKSSYDIIIAWINLWYFDYNIFPYFHSSQAKSWYNFSNIKKTSLDILLEDLKSIWDKKETKEKILEILKNEQIIKTLYTPKINLLIDKNIKNIIVPEKLTDKTDRRIIFNNMYVKWENIINFKDKWALKFINFLYKKLND